MSTKVYVWQTIPKAFGYVGEEQICDPRKLKKDPYAPPEKEKLYADRDKAEAAMEDLAKVYREVSLSDMEFNSRDPELVKEWRDRGFRKVREKDKTYWEIPPLHEDDRIGSRMCFVVKKEVIQ